MKNLLLILFVVGAVCKPHVNECTDIRYIIIQPEFSKHFQLDNYFKEIVEVNYTDNSLSHDLDCKFTLPSGLTIQIKEGNLTKDGLESNKRGEVVTPKLYVTRSENCYHFFMTETNLSLTAKVINDKVIITSKGVY